MRPATSLAFWVRKSAVLMNKSVEALVEDIRMLGEEQYQIVQDVREIAKAVVQGLSEEVKYGGVLFSSGAPFGGIYVYRGHVSLEFSHGAQIVDDGGLLEGAGKYRRHLKLRNLDEVPQKAVARYLQLAHSAALHAAKAASSR